MNAFRQIYGKYVAVVLAISCFGLSSLYAAEFGAYYTKVDSGEEFERYSRTLPTADIVVRNIGREGGRLVFWRGSSYLPYWEVDGKKWFLDELTERSGDGPAKRPDNVNTYSVARIVESSAKGVVVHWRYLPRFEGRNPHFNAVNIPYHRDKTGGKEPEHLVDTDKFVDETYTIRPDGSVTRTFKKGTEKLDDWLDPANQLAQELRLSSRGIEVKKVIPAETRANNTLILRADILSMEGANSRGNIILVPKSE